MSQSSGQITTKRDVCHLAATLVTANLLPRHIKFGPPAFHLFWWHRDPYKIMPLTAKHSHTSFRFHPATRAPPCTSFSVQSCNPRFQHRCCSLLVAFSWSRDEIGQIRAKVEQGLGSWLDVVSKNFFPLHLLLEWCGMRLWRRKGSRGLSGSSVHIVTSSTLSILQDVFGDVFRQATFQLGVIWIAFLPILHTYQQTGTDYVQIHTASTKFGQQMSIVLLCQNTKPKTSFAPQLQIASPAILLLDTRTTNQPKQVEVFQSLSMLL